MRVFGCYPQGGFGAVTTQSHYEVKHGHMVGREDIFYFSLLARVWICAVDLVKFRQNRNEQARTVVPRGVIAAGETTEYRRPAQ